MDLAWHGEIGCFTSIASHLETETIVRFTSLRSLESFTSIASHLETETQAAARLVGSRSGFTSIASHLETETGTWRQAESD